MQKRRLFIRNLRHRCGSIYTYIFIYISVYVNVLAGLNHRQLKVRDSGCYSLLDIAGFAV